MLKRSAVEPQNQEQIDTYKIKCPCKMGHWTSHIWRSDPRHLGFLLARYKFCAKMQAGKGNVLEIGCGDGFGLPVVLQAVNSVHGIDFEPLVLEDAGERMKNEGIKGVSFSIVDITKEPLGKSLHGKYLQIS
jgi:protein-L-isoaspartate O-methyltransferase